MLFSPAQEAGGFGGPVEGWFCHGFLDVVCVDCPVWSDIHLDTIFVCVFLVVNVLFKVFLNSMQLCHTMEKKGSDSLDSSPNLPRATIM